MSADAMYMSYTTYIYIYFDFFIFRLLSPTITAIQIGTISFRILFLARGNSIAAGPASSFSKAHTD